MKENIFERVLVVKRFEDFRGLDLSKKNFKNIPLDVLVSVDFDTITKWPSKEKLPAGFKPEIILENGKNPGLGILELHKEGIDGRGINVAIIDQKLDLNHHEYAHNVVNYEEIDTFLDEGISMHGPGVTSLLVGKNCGIAPGARLFYKKVTNGEGHSNWESCSDSLNKIIDYNNIVEETEKIKVVSYSNGYPNPGFKGDLENWIKTIKKAKDNGIIFVDGNTFFDLDFNGGGNFDEKENIDKYYNWGQENLDQYNKIFNIEDNSKDRIKPEGRIVIPCDCRTVASSWNENNQYSYYSKGGISWSIPYLAGIFTLMLQVNKNLKMEEMVKIIHDTVFVNKNGLKIINPRGIIDTVKSQSNK